MVNSNEISLLFFQITEPFLAGASVAGKEALSAAESGNYVNREDFEVNPCCNFLIF